MYVRMYSIYVKCMEMFLFGGFPCGAFRLQTDNIIMNAFIITTENLSCYNIPNSVGPI